MQQAALPWPKRGRASSGTLLLATCKPLYAHCAYRQLLIKAPSVKDTMGNSLAPVQQSEPAHHNAPCCLSWSTLHIASCFPHQRQARIPASKRQIALLNNAPTTPTSYGSEVAATSMDHQGLPSCFFGQSLAMCPWALHLWHCTDGRPPPRLPCEGSSHLRLPPPANTHPQSRTAQGKQHRTATNLIPFRPCRCVGDARLSLTFGLGRFLRMHATRRPRQPCNKQAPTGGGEGKILL